MIKHTTLIIFALVIFCFLSCNPTSTARLWFYTHSLGNIDHNSTLNPTSFLNLQKDGLYTKDFGTFEYGRWIKKNDQLWLTDSKNTTSIMQIKYASAKDLQLITGKNIIACFEAQPSFSESNVDPFTLDNNKWRVRATHKESEQEIKERLRNHCKFWEAYFKWAMENEIEYVDVRSTPTPIKIYGNGFTLKDFAELPEAWRSYFYDIEDCKVANNLLYEIFQFKNISWPHTDNKYKMFLSAFQQMQQMLK